MRSFLPSLISIPIELVDIAVGIWLDKRWVHKKLIQLQREHPLSLEPATIQKIEGRHAIFYNIIYKSFLGLYDRTPGDEEKMQLLYFVICVTLGDNFFDSNTYSREQLYQLAFYPEAYPSVNEVERFFIKYSILLNQYAASKPGYQHIIRELYQSQVDSLRQLDPTIPGETLAEITYRKGGYSILVSRFYLDLLENKSEELCWYQMGALIQLGNDIYDVYKDLHEGIHTLPNRMQKVKEIENELSTRMQEFKASVRSLAVSDCKKKKLLRRTAIIYALSFTALDQYKILENKFGDLPDLKTLPRSALIIDMELWRNRWTLMKYVISLSRLE